MIIRLKGATFTTNIGTLDSWSIKYTTTNGSVTKKSGVTSIKKDDADGEVLVFEFDTAKYTYKSGTIVSNGVSAGTISVSGNTITVNVNAGTTLSGKVEINFVMEAIGGGEEEPEDPVNPSSGHTFTINPTPTTATVTLTAEGYTQNGNSINVPSGTVVTYTTAAEKYKTRANEIITITENTTKEVVLAPLPYASGATMPSDGVVPENMFVKLPDTWMNNSGTDLDQILGEGSGNTIGYHCCYLPINVSGYTKIDLTAQTTAACYYQFFKADGSWTLTDVRQKVDKGASKTVDIPSNAKYLVLAESRTNSTDANAVNGYLKYFPVSVKIY